MINSFLINNNTAEVLNQAIRRTNRDHTATKIVLRMVYITHTRTHWIQTHTCIQFTNTPQQSIIHLIIKDKAKLSVHSAPNIIATTIILSWTFLIPGSSDISIYTSANIQHPTDVDPRLECLHADQFWTLPIRSIQARLTSQAVPPSVQQRASPEKFYVPRLCWRKSAGFGVSL